ncbi:Protein of unknown function (DUF581) [Melia azedarach]|uniref:Uncharacterized protein n=1 Tax=Melia azedarach TaxID=155640 RepID=A0ACC1YIM3_MELAZ|nr:Protein of unknown function (DUF581) [Melia azedarach]
MSARRRCIRSSSQGELSVFNQIRPIESPVGYLDIKKRPGFVTNGKPARQPPPRPVAWTLGSLETVDMQSNKKVDDGFCGFLKACSLCKKKLEETADVYMYGYLRAFCSPECRDDQIAVDGFDKEFSKQPTEMGMGGMLATKARQAFGTKRFK